jgi:hypothetical protein
VTCGFYERLLTAGARCCPSFAGRLRTHYGPGSGARQSSDLLHAIFGLLTRSRPIWLSTCDYEYPLESWLTVSDRWLAAPERPHHLWLARYAFPSLRGRFPAGNAAHGR